MLNTTTSSGWDLGSITLTVEVSGDFSETGRIDMLDTDGNYFGIDSAAITDGAGLPCHSMSTVFRPETNLVQ